MANYEYPKVSIVNTVYNVTRMFEAKKGYGGYTSAQGYTVTPGSNRIHFITSIKEYVDQNKNIIQKTAVAHVMGKQSSDGAVGGQYSDDNLYGHANDCAYYENGFFIAQGGGNAPELTQIIRLNNKLSDKDKEAYNYSPNQNGNFEVDPLKTITGIAHISDGYFALSQGMKVSICKLHTDTKIFKEIARFGLSGIGDHLSRKDCDRKGQGIYCTGSKIYKAFSYEKGGTIKRNDIGVFKFNSSTPSQITKATFQTSYSCDRTEYDLFEVESLGSPDGGNTMYMLTNIEQNGSKDTLYKVSFS